jgi:hypothetical protein
VVGTADLARPAGKAAQHVGDGGQGGDRVSARLPVATDLVDDAVLVMVIVSSTDGRSYFASAGDWANTHSRISPPGGPETRSRSHAGLADNRGDAEESTSTSAIHLRATFGGPTEVPKTLIKEKEVWS